MNIKEFEQLPEILREAAVILAGKKEMRFPIIDELEGFAIMLEEPEGPLSNHSDKGFPCLCCSVEAERFPKEEM